MADTVTNSKTVSFELAFTDGDEMKITQSNPINDQDLPAAIIALETAIRDGNIFTSTSSNAAFSEIKTTKVIEKSIVDLDISQ